MALKFFNVLKANAEIERLESELSALTETNKTLSEQNTELSGLTATNVQLTADATTAKATIAKLSGDLTAAQNNATLAETAHAAALAKATADVDGRVKTEGAREAAAVLAKAGQPPVKQELNAQATVPEKNLAEQWQALSGVEKTAFYKANKAALQKLAKKK